MLFLPFFSMNYRYSLAKSDTFRQAGFKDKHIRFGEHLSTLITTLVSFTIAYVILVLILFVRNKAAVAPVEDEMFTYEVAHLHYIYYLPLYFSILGFAIGQYFTSYFLISRSNNFLNSLITLFLGECFLTFIPSIIGVLIFERFMMLSEVGSIASMVFPIVFLQSFFNGLIIKGSTGLEFSIAGTGTIYDGSNNLVIFIASMSIFWIVSALGIISFLLEKDPSSEWANKPGSDKPYQEIIYHMGFGSSITIVAMTMITSIDSFIWLVLVYFLYSATYYTMYGLLNRNFKLNLRQILTLVGVTLLSLIIAIAFLALYSARTN